MIVRTSRAGEASYDLLEDKMVEQCEGFKYFLNRSDLKAALPILLKGVKARIIVGLIKQLGDPSEESASFIVTEGKTQRGKKFIEIGCKRFVGEQRRKLIAWANGAK